MELIADFSTPTLVIMAVIAVLTLWFTGPGYSSHSAPHAPTILTSIGIFGTFLGVAMGLMAFDTTAIEASVPDLIEGLKTAFWTSIAGLFGALLVKFRHLFAVVRQGKVAERYRQATVTDLANILGDIRDSLGEEQGDGLRAALSTGLGRQADELAALREAMGRYQQDMADANAQALVNAIEQVMRDFNTQINTQYGDNFRELNQAVGQMLTWQNNYKQQLEELVDAQRASGDLLDKASGAYENMVAHAEVFSDVSNNLATMLEALRQQSQGLDSYLGSLAKLVNQAADGLPSLEQRIDSLTTQLSNSVLSNQQRLDQQLTTSADALRDTAEEMNRTLAQTLTAAQDQLGDRLTRLAERTEQQVIKLDEAMADELTKALKTFGYQLTSLSEKFVNDYAPLTDKLKQLVQLAGQPEAEDVKRGKRARVTAQ